MRPRWQHVVTAFFVAGWAGGAGGLAGAVYFGWQLAELHAHRTPAPPPPSGSSNVVVGMVEAGTRVASVAGRLLDSLGEGILTALLVCSLGALALSLSMLATARGLRAGRPLARRAAQGLMVVLFALTAAAFFAAYGSLVSMAPAVGCAAAVYGWLGLRQFPQ